MKKEKILLFILTGFAVLALTAVLVFAASSTQNSYKDKLQLMKCKNNATFEKNNCLKEAIVYYHNCSSGKNIHKNGMNFWKLSRECMEKLRPLQKDCRDNYNTAILNCKNTNITNPVCGNSICETGEASFCPLCVYSHPACMVPCSVGTCPQDCQNQNISG